MAGCTVDRNIFTISYDNLSSEIASQHNDWTPHQVRTEAARLFRPSYRQNMESVKQEFANEKEYAGTPFIFVDGKVNFVDGLRTINILTFHENQLRDTPDKYSPEQHETSLLIQTAFQNGATEVVTSYLEPNGQRDIVVMTLDRATGKGKMRIINTLNDHTMDEMRTLVKNNFSHLSEAHPVANAFILSDTHISKEQIMQKGTLPARQTHSVLKETVRVAKNTISEIPYTAAPVDIIIQRSRDDRIKARPDIIGDSFIHNLRRKFKHKEYKKSDVLEVKKHEINLFGRSFEKVKDTRRKIREKIISSVATLLFVHATGVGIGGTSELLHAILRPLDSSVESAKRSNMEKLVKHILLSEKIRVFKREQPVLYKKEKILRKKEKKVLHRIERRSLRRKEIFHFRTEKKLIQHKERRSVRKKEKILWEMVRKLVKQGKTIERKSFIKTVNRKEIAKKLRIENRDKKVALEKQHVIDFSIALVIWFLLHMQTPSRLPKNRHEAGLTKREKSEKFVFKERSPWLLFAIIWHLAMIRESRGAGSGFAGHKKKQISVQKQIIIQRAVLPPLGIIFAFAS